MITDRDIDYIREYLTDRCEGEDEMFFLIAMTPEYHYYVTNINPEGRSRTELLLDIAKTSYDDGDADLPGINLN